MTIGGGVRSLLLSARRAAYWRSVELGEALYGVANRAVATRYYDLVRSRAARWRRGARPPSSRVAVYVVYPIDGLQPSHAAAIRHMEASGYTPLVVSNAALSDADREMLLPRCLAVVERPNVGYDFGGYRDAVLWLLAETAGLERLALLNDSCWFPLPGAANWFELVDGTDHDLVSASHNGGWIAPPPERFRDMEWSINPDLQFFHYCSYAVCFKRKILADHRFLNFWRAFKLSNRKFVTVRRGELGLSRWAIAQGFSHRATLALDRLDEEFRALEPAALRGLIRSLAMPEDPDMRSVVARELAADPGLPERDRDAATRLALTAVARTGPAFSMFEYAYRTKGFPFLKKSPVWLDRHGSDRVLAFVASLPEPEGWSLRAEAEALRRRRAASFAA